MKTRIVKLSLTSLCLCGVLWCWTVKTNPLAVMAQTGSAKGPTSSGPLALSPDDKFLWVANPDTDSVSVLEVGNDLNQKLAEIRVGDEPNGVAIHPNGQTVYVANTVSGSVSVIDAASRKIVRTLFVGTEPYGLALTPNGSKLYVANARSNDVLVIDTASHQPVARIVNIPEPRGLAITSDGDSDDQDEKVYVTQFNAVDVPGAIIGADNYKEGRVTVISTATDKILKEVVLAPQTDVGFNSNGSALQRIAATNPPTFTVKTGAFPNSLNAVAIKGNRAYLPNNAASPDGPVRFNVNVQSFLNVIDTANDTEGKTGDQLQSINMNRGINFEPASEKKLFIGMPWHIAFEPNSNEGWVVAMAANILVKVTLDENGTPTINAPRAAGETGNIVRIETGQKPTGLVINSTGTRGYVANEVSRDVTVVNLDANQVVATVSSAELPTPGTTEATVQYGKAIFFSSAKVNVPTLGPVIPTGRLSSEGWSGCVSCHAFGLTDQVVWIFGAGPRRSLPLNATFNPHNPADQKVLNYSAIFDEVQDFENNIRGTSGGLGLITTNGQVDGPQDPTLNAFNPANTGRSAALDALNQFIARGIRTPISPLRNVAPLSPLGRQIALGRKVFVAAGCYQCHGGGGWSSARRDYTPPPAASDIINGQVFRFLRRVDTFNANNVNEIRQNGAPPLGADGFNPPSLLGAWAMGPLLHNGSALTIADVLDNPTHRRAGQFSFRPDLLNNEELREALVSFLKSIDAATPPVQGIPPR
ncbi:MAG: beta-propeller fold lactonase family protein [Acidobacteria bacterium]|nr:beta-propeller fold lactonase family protein [Acidobacteriota bacterium]